MVKTVGSFPNSANIETVPELPVATDPEPLDYYWDNYSESKDTLDRLNKIERQAQKTTHWQNLELIGDAYIFGERNCCLIKLLEDHENVDLFLIQVGKTYRLDEWVRIPPSSAQIKDWVDLVKAWIGAIINESLLFDGADPLADFNQFLALPEFEE